MFSSCFFASLNTAAADSSLTTSLRLLSTAPAALISAKSSPCLIVHENFLRLFAVGQHAINVWQFIWQRHSLCVLQSLSGIILVRGAAAVLWKGGHGRTRSDMTHCLCTLPSPQHDTCVQAHPMSPALFTV